MKPANALGWLSLLCLTAFSPDLQAKTFVIPHILERSGTSADTQFTFDTTLFITYNASLHGGDARSAQVALYLYDEQTGLPMRGSAGTICAPCTYTLDSNNRKVAVQFDGLIEGPGGGFDQPVKLGFAVVEVSGTGADAVNLQGFVVNSHTSAFDLSVFGFEPQPIPATASRKAVFPHLLESSGRTASTPYSFDTVIYAAYAGGLPGSSSEGGAELQLYLYDETGAPMQSATSASVCNPCTFPLGTGGQRMLSIVIDDLIVAAGGFGDSSVREGFAVVSIQGADPENVVLHGSVVNAHTSPFDLSVFGFEPQPIATAAQARTFVLPHLLEKSGTSATTEFTFDTTVFATYTPGLGGLPQGSGATVSLYLYDDSGAFMQGKNGTAVCAPCTVNLGGAAGIRKQSLRLDDLIVAAGGFDTEVKQGFGLVVVSGEDPAGINLQGFGVNSHTSAFDLSVFGFEPQEVKSPVSKAFVLPHILEKDGFTSNPFTFDTTVFATYSGGLPGGTPGASATLNLYLFNSADGQPLTGAVGEVCNPCAFDLSASNRKLAINIEDLIKTRAGGFVQPVVSAFGVASVQGDAANVHLQGFIVNSHTSAFDLSVFGYEPQPLKAAALKPMNIQFTTTGGRPSLRVPTVIGGNYAVEASENLTDWIQEFVFRGDGTMKTNMLLPSPATIRLYRIRAE